MVDSAASRVDVIIPALNESQAIGRVVSGLRETCARTILVVDNGSTDDTAARAEAAGARVIREPRKGYGSACLAGIAALADDTEVVVFLDGDASDDPTVLARLIDPILRDAADLVVGSRAKLAESGSLTLAQRTGNAIATAWLRRRFGLETTDLGPFRAIRRSALDRLDMRDAGYGWTVEMQIKAAQRGLRYQEIAVPYRRRIGTSKISGTVRGSLGAGAKILGLLAWYDLSPKFGLSRFEPPR